MTCEELLLQLNSMQPFTPVDFTGAAPTVLEWVEAFRSLDSTERQAVTSGLNRQAMGFLFAFADRAATEALRRKSQGSITLGLMALAIEGGKLDYRDSCFLMAKLFHSAQKSGLDAASLFAEAGAYVGDPRFASMLAGFPLRQPAHRNLAAFWLREKVTPAGLTYEHYTPLRDKLRRRVRKVRRFFGWV